MADGVAHELAADLPDLEALRDAVDLDRSVTTDHRDADMPMQARLAAQLDDRSEEMDRRDREVHRAILVHLGRLAAVLDDRRRGGGCDRRRGGGREGSARARG